MEIKKEIEDSRPEDEDSDLWTENKPLGPALVNPDEIVTKTAVPIDPPMAINWIWRLHSAALAGRYAQGPSLPWPPGALPLTGHRLIGVLIVAHLNGLFRKDGHDELIAGLPEVECR